jgi:hypothetical protein
MATNEKSVFSQFIDSPERPEISPPADLRSLPVGQLLYWLTNNWKKSTVSIRDLCVFGPRVTRNRKNATDLAETLAKRGFLLPIRAHRIDRRVWLVVRETEQMGGPKDCSKL